MKFAQMTFYQNQKSSKRLILFLGILMGLFTTFEAVSQRDLLVTQAGEEIRCRILDETPTRFIYAYVSKGEKVLRNEIFKNLVTSFKYNYYDSDLVKTDRLPGNSKRDGGKAERVDTRRNTSTTSKKSRRNSKANQTEVLNEEAMKTGNSENEQIANSREVKNSDQKNGEGIQNDARKVAEGAKQTTSQNSNASLQEEGSEIESTKSQGELSVREQKALERETKKVTEEKKTSFENEELLVSPKVESEFKNYLKFRVGVRAGISNIINNSLTSTNEYDLFREKLNKGWAFGADAAYFLTEEIGLGLMFTNFMSKNSATGLTYPNLVSGVLVDNGSIATNISNKFVGPVFFYRKAIDFKTFVVLGLSPGMNFYNENGNYNGDNFDFKARQFGGSASLGLDFLLGNDIIGRDIILSLEAGYNYSRYNELDYGSTRGIKVLDSPLIMDRLDFSIGLRFMRFPKYLKLSSY